MRKSCERIAAVLGIKDGAANGGGRGVVASFAHRGTTIPGAPQIVSASKSRSPLRGNPISDYAPEQPMMNFTNLNNNSLGGMGARGA